MTPPLTTNPTPLQDRKLASPPFWLVSVFMVLVVSSWIPLVVIARARLDKTREPRIHLIQDMDEQPRLEAQDYSEVFADNRAMRPEILGTVSRSALPPSDAFANGYTRSGDRFEFIADFPKEVIFDQALMERGQNRFNVYCMPCHGADGMGQGPIHRRAAELQNAGTGGAGSWIPPSNLHDEAIRGRPDGHLYNTVTNGIRSMAGYSQQITDPYDRWAVVAYVRALQLSQNAPIGPQQAAGSGQQTAGGNGQLAGGSEK